MEATARPETILAAIKPLGLFDQRMIGLVAVSPTAKPPVATLLLLAVSRSSLLSRVCPRQVTERFLHAPVFELGLKPPLKVRNPLPPSRSCASLHNPGAWLPDRWPRGCNRCTASGNLASRAT